MKGKPRDRLVETALRLFCRHGFHATGIDTILAEAGVAKMTLYNHFASKEALILATLRRRDAEFRGWFVREVESRSRSPRGRLAAVFDVIADWCARPGFYGCMFINASAEFHRRDDPIHVVAAENKRAVTRYLRSLAEAAGARDPKSLAEQLTVLVEGAIVLSHVYGGTAPVRRAAAAARPILEAAFGPARRSLRTRIKTPQTVRRAPRKRARPAA
ncbi:MAG TPA: TetR/AcrR family transcriptional regulator [Alphaproteobacteria bacterium]|jgi:AcrR family transcriptional regulator|nr:TetR/AcrR family transcriptional regulator [Alphaproteobacteria bacterium]